MSGQRAGRTNLLRLTPMIAIVVTIAACSGADPAVTTATTGPQELTPGPLAAGTCTMAGFVPAIEFTLGEGWTAGTLRDGFFDVQQNPGSPDVIAVQFGVVEGVVGAGGTMLPAITAADAVNAIKENPGLVVFGESSSQLGGHDGFTVEVENQGEGTTSVMRVSPGILGFDPGRRLWISLFDTSDGLLVVMVGGSVADWDQALAAAEPVLESVVIARG